MNEKDLIESLQFSIILLVGVAVLVSLYAPEAVDVTTDVISGIILIVATIAVAILLGNTLARTIEEILD